MTLRVRSVEEIEAKDIDIDANTINPNNSMPTKKWICDNDDWDEDRLNIDGEWVNAPSVGKEDEDWEWDDPKEESEVTNNG